MTPQEKAKELIWEFEDIKIEYCYSTDAGDGYMDEIYDEIDMPDKSAIKCALICVDEIIANTQGEVIEWWKEVKSILEKM